MSAGKQKLSKDLKILEVMVTDMEAYLDSDILFWTTIQADLPKLTLGGYLMRQHRLLTLRDTLLDASERDKLETIVSQFNQVLSEKRIQFERKAHRELEARLRQWGEYLKELNQEESDSAAYYHAAVETRAMIAAMVEKLQASSYQLEVHISEQLDHLDRKLRQQWQPGAFIWSSEWQSAYPQAIYWWLYGKPI